MQAQGLCYDTAGSLMSAVARGVGAMGRPATAGGTLLRFGGPLSG